MFNRKSNNIIRYNKPFLPPMEEYESYLREIWEDVWLTNNGPLVEQLEDELTDYLGVRHLSLVTNGTMALQIAIRALDLKGEIITTPFTYVATTSSIVWEGGSPVFVDIDPQTLNIDPEKIEEAITPETTAIIATHIFGNPCDIDAIGHISGQHNLKVIYDAAQGFGSSYKGKSIYNFGDISTASFHATKLFHTVEGGGIFTGNKKLYERVNWLRNFGHDAPENFKELGINGKNSEFHAAMGLCNLKYIDEILSVRAKQSSMYDELLADLDASKPEVLKDAKTNHSFYPLLFDSEQTVIAVKNTLEREQIYPRRYFYPSLNQIEYVKKQATPIADDVASRILCLPLYHTLTETEQTSIAEIILKTANTNVYS